MRDSISSASTMGAVVANRTVSLALKRFTTVHAPNRIWRNKGFICKMSNDSQTLTHTITLPNKQSEPVRIVVAPGVSDSDFCSAIDSSLFKQWLGNLQSKTGILAEDTMTLGQVLIQVYALMSFLSRCT